MKNNNGKGLYEIGEIKHHSCGCVERADEVGYTWFVHPDCEIDNQYHPNLRGFKYEPLENLKGGIN